VNLGESLTRLSVWLALVGYGAGAGLLLLARSRQRWLDGARWAWTIGCGFMVAHVALAFGSHHHWSHVDAYLQTARRTDEMIGARWGGGIYFNYVFIAAWIADAAWWWVAPSSFARRPRWLTSIWHGFAFFMVFNGAVIFAMGPVRWFGALICGCLVVLSWSRWHHRVPRLRR
jgi:hypothetical protein